MKKRDHILDMECDRALYKISKTNLEIKVFDDTWNNSGFAKKFSEKNQFAIQTEKKLHLTLNVKFLVNF